MNTITPELAAADALTAEALKDAPIDAELFQLMMRSAHKVLTEFGVILNHEIENDPTEETVQTIVSIVRGMTKYRGMELSDEQIMLVTYAIYARSQVDAVLAV
jgi:hypothetical protein